MLLELSAASLQSQPQDDTYTYGSFLRLGFKIMKFRVQGLGDILGLYGDNGKEHGNYYNGLYMEYIGGCQNYGLFLGPYYNTSPSI